MKNELRPEVAAEFDCNITPTRVVVQRPKRWQVDLRKVSLSQARKLVAEGFPHLGPKGCFDEENAHALPTDYPPVHEVEKPGESEEDKKPSKTKKK